MILYVENTNVSKQKLIELINELGKVAGYKINIQKSVVFLYTNNDISETENFFKSSLKLGQKIKCLGKTLIKEVKDLCNENYKT